MTLSEQFSINRSRLLQYLSEMAAIGATAKGGCNRQALTELDHQGRALFLRWCEKIGGRARRDTMGNLFVHFAGTNDSLPPVFMSSHLDTQPTGGKYDGVYGVLSALEVMHTLSDNHLKTLHPIEIVVWTNEEGARFAPAMMGSGVFSGVLSQSDMYQVTDRHGTSVKQALLDNHEMGDTACQAFPIKAALELHIEQGPILEAENLPIGIVTGVQGMNWYTVTFQGETTHAGPTPMSMRKDPIKVMSTFASKLYEFVEAFDDQAKVTIGDLKVLPGSRNTVPHTVSITVDLRHPEQDKLITLTQFLFQLSDQLSEKIKIQVDTVWQSPAVNFHPTCINAIEQSCLTSQTAYRKMVSGAGHDSVYLSQIAPVGMIFIPCKNGISHNELETITDSQAEIGAQILLHSVLHLAQTSSGVNHD